MVLVDNIPWWPLSAQTEMIRIFHLKLRHEVLIMSNHILSSVKMAPSLTDLINSSLYRVALLN